MGKVKNAQKNELDYLPATPEQKEPNQRKVFHIKDLTPIVAKTENQAAALKLLQDEDKLIVSLLGCAGTGKTFLAMQRALHLLLTEGNGYDRIVVIRSSVPTRDIGFLPGDPMEKMASYEDPYIAMFDELFPWKNSYFNLKKTGKVVFKPTSFLRGSTFHNAIVIVDEPQDLNFHELDTSITRIGENARLFLAGDTAQDDLQYRRNDVSGLVKFLGIINELDMHGSVEFTPDDIVRGPLVKAYLTTKWNKGL